MKSRLLLVTVVVVIALASCVPFSSRPMPDIRGREGVDPSPTAPVEIIRDKNGIAHITAVSRNDAYFGQGYAHAQDRFFQMEFWRRVGQGRLSELFGAGTVSSDAYLRTMGYDDVARAEYEMAPAWFQEALDSYADGVNAYIHDKKPGQLSFEFLLLKLQGVDIEIEPWEGWNSLNWVKVMAQDIDIDFTSELHRLEVIRAVGLEMARDYYPPYRLDYHPTIIDDEELPVRADSEVAAASIEAELAKIGLGLIPQGVYSKLVGVRDRIAGMTLGEGPGLGSNGWVISGEHTESGKPILCSDPHLGIQMPSIWYEVSLHYATPDGRPVDIHGMGFAGLPGIIIGHNGDIAWGMTNGYSDQQDLYIERINPEDPNQYLAGNSWVDMETRVERIEVSKKDPVYVTVRSTRNGPVMTDHGGYVPYRGFFTEPVQLFPPDMQLSALTLKWTALEPGTTLQSMLMITEAQSFDEFREAVSYWSGPAEGVVCADTAGTIGYALAGLLPIRGEGTGALPSPGWEDAYQWQGYAPYDETPWVKNPESGYLISANNLQASSLYPYTIANDPVPGYRARRITEMLEPLIQQGSVTIDAMPEIQLDCKNMSAEEILPYVEALPIAALGLLLESEYQLLAEPPEEEEITRNIGAAVAAIGMLGPWDRQMYAGSAQAALFARFFLELVDRIYEDHFSPDFYATGKVISATSRVQNRISLLLTEPDNPWWDNSWTADHRETRDEILAQALARAYQSLEEDLGANPARWKWGDIHGATFRNQSLGESGVTFIENMFNRGPFPTHGGFDQVRRSSVKMDDPEEVSTIVALRMIVDLADWSTGMFIHPTGQSGHIRSRHYDDFIDMWVDGEYFVHPWSAEDIDEATRARLILE